MKILKFKIKILTKIEFLIIDVIGVLNRINVKLKSKDGTYKMSLIQHSDYDFKWNKWNDAIIDHHPSGMRFIGCGTNNKYHNLLVAMQTMVKIIQCEEKK